MVNDKLTLTVPETARRLGIGKNLAYDAIQRGEIPSIRVGHRLLVPVVALEAMMQRAGNDESTTSECRSIDRGTQEQA